MLIQAEYVQVEEVETEEGFDQHRMALGRELPYSAEGSLKDVLGKLKKEYGRLASKMYIDKEDGTAQQTGYVFEKRKKDYYGKEYVQETWVTFLEKEDTVTRTRHYFDFKKRGN